MGLEKLWANYKVDIPQENGDLNRLAKELSEEDIHPALFDGGGHVVFDQENPPDGKITATELLNGVDGILKGGTKETRKKVLHAIHDAGIPLTSKMWVLQRDGLSGAAVAHFNTKASRLVAGGGLEKNAPAIERNLTAVTHFEPDNAAHYINLGNFHIVRKDYAKALAAYQGAQGAWEREKYANSEHRWELPLLQGHAQFGLGDFQGARQSYTVYLNEFPKADDVRKLRLEADQYLINALTADSPEAVALRTEMDIDAALVMAAEPAEQEARIAEIEARLADNSLTEDKRAEVLGLLDAMGREYLRLAEGPFETPSEAERVRERLNALAERCFTDLARAAASSKEPAFHAREPFFRAYALLAAGKEGEAVAILREVQEKGFQALETACAEDPNLAAILRNDAIIKFYKIKQRGEALLAEGKTEEAQKVLAGLPAGLLEANAIVRAYDDDLLVGANLQGIRIWKAYLEDGEKVTRGQASSIKGRAMSFITGDFDGSETQDKIKEIFEREKRIIARVEEKLAKSEALTNWTALEQLKEDPSVPEDERERIAHILSREDALNEGDVLDGILQYTTSLHPDENLEESLLRNAFIMESREGVSQTPYATYALVADFSKNADHRKRAEDEMKALEKGGGGLGRGVLKFVYGSSTLELVFDALTGRLAFRAARLAQRAFLLRTGSVWGGRATLVGTAGTISFVGTTLKEAFTGDPERVFTAEHLAKSYGAHLLMTGTMLGFSGAASRFAPGMARGLGLVTKGGAELSTWGKRFVWASSHAFGLGGTVASTQGAMLVGLRPRVSFGESLAMDLINYGIISRADRLADIPLGGKKGMQAGDIKLHADIQALEAAHLAKPHAERWARSTFGGEWDRMPRDRRERLVAKHADYLAQAAQNRAGFSSRSFVAQVEKGDFAAANAYLKKFGLRPLFSPHQEMGIVPPASTLAPSHWSRQAISKATQIFIDGKAYTVESVQGNTVTYHDYVSVKELYGQKKQRVFRTVEVTDALLLENFGEMPIGQIRPTENGLSQTRLDAAKNHLDEPILVYRDVGADGRVQYFALDGHHRLAAAHAQGKATVKVQIVEYTSDAVQNRLKSPAYAKYPVPETVAGLKVNPARTDDYRGGPGAHDADQNVGPALAKRPSGRASLQDLRLNEGETQQIGDLEFTLADGEVWVRGVEGGEGVVVRGTGDKSGAWIPVGEGDTLLVNGRHYARVLGEFRPVTPARDNAPVLAHGENGVILDNGDGNLTKVGGSVERNKQLDAEQYALAIIQFHGLDIAPPLVGRPHPSELIIGKLKGKSLDRLSPQERKQIKPEHWKGLEDGLKSLQELGIHHNDISAGNIIWDGKKLRLVDFGLARFGFRTSDDFNRLQRIQDAIAKGEEGQALYPLPNVNDFENQARIPVADVPFSRPDDLAPDTGYRKAARQTVEADEHVGPPSEPEKK